ncbi:hypothetical protein HWV62_38767 [Athelia sp. TMB]|nr:hypothetical protein HWV62_38767 [Athelia sp. TMB]
MGGFVFDLNDDDGEPEEPMFLPQSRTRMTLTSVGVRFLMDHHPDLLPDLSETSITDRTRASSLSKAVLLAQITWFCMNCIARLGQNLPLSLLEVTTLAHGLCTLVTYALWWSKPLNIAEPTLIRGREAREACALMTMCSPDEKYAILGTVSIQFPAEMASIQLSQSISGRPPPSPREATAPLRTPESPQNPLQPKPFITLVPGRQVLEGTDFTPKKEETKTPFHHLKTLVLYNSRAEPWYAKRREPNEPVVLHPADTERWKLAYAAMERYGLLRSGVELPEKPYLSPQTTLQSSSDFKGRGIKAIVHSNLSAIALTLIYGLPHFLGWNAHFPTPLEQLLWRIATLAVTLWGAAMASVVALIITIRLLMKDFTGERRGETVLVACASSLYIVTAGYLLVESMRQLLYLEPAAYALPSWSNYLPHFS